MAGVTSDLKHQRKEGWSRSLTGHPRMYVLLCSGSRLERRLPLTQSLLLQTDVLKPGKLRSLCQIRLIQALLGMCRDAALVSRQLYLNQMSVSNTNILLQKRRLSMYKSKIQPLVSAPSAIHRFPSFFLTTHETIHIYLSLGGAHCIPFPLLHSVPPNIITLRYKDKRDIKHGYCD